MNNQRPALLLASTPGTGSGNSVFIGWSSHGDNGQYHGWVIAYDAANVSKQNGAWTDTPNGSRGGIWMSGGGLSSDGLGNIFAADGNGTFDTNTGGKDFGDSAFKLSFGTSGLTATDSFTPADQNNLNGVDNDMGTSAVMLLPTQNGSLPNLIVTSDKSGTIYLLDRNKMGGYNASADASLQSFSNGGYSVHNSFALLGNAIYLASDGGPLQAWSLNPSTERFTTVPTSESPTTYGCSGCDGAGSTPAISANGFSSAIVWALDNSAYGNGAAILHAYDPVNLHTEFYNSTQAANSRDAASIAVKFTTPTVANGHVYVAGRNAITVYGLIGSGGSDAQTQVSLSSAYNAIGIYTDGSTFSTAGGIDRAGAAYSAALLGPSLTFSGITYTFGPANGKNVVKGTRAPVITLTPGKFATLNFLATGLNSNQPSQVFTVTYSDGSTTQVTQSISDWFTPQNYPGEAVALTTAYRNTSNGTKDGRAFDLFEYAVPLNNTKTVSSIKLPNNSNLAVLAITLD